MASVKPKSKLAYLSYEQIQPKIDGGLLDEYDLIFEKNQRVMYILDKDKNIVPVKSRFDSYPSESSAVTAINSKTDTYVGQIINILEDGEYVPYTVNLDASTGSYYITPIGTRDYNKLYNKPIVNIVANNEVIISELDDGIYSLVGNYRIDPLDETHRIATSKIIFIKETIYNENNIQYVYVTEIGSKTIQVYLCTDVSFTEDRYVYLSELGNEIEDVIHVEVPIMIDDYVQTHQATDEDIQDLFS